MEAGHEDETSSQLDDRVVIVEVDPGPVFRTAEVGGRPVDGPAPDGELRALLASTEIVMAEAWSSGRPVRFETERDGSRYEVYVSPLAPRQGRDRLIVYLTRRPERRERRRNVVNAAIVDALPGSVALVDPEGVIRAVNAGWVRYGLERSNDGLLADAGTNYLDITDRAAIHDPSARAAAEAIRSVLAGGVDLAASDYPTEGSNEPAWFTMRVAPVEIDDERWAVVSHEDVTALRHALDRWHSTFSNAAVPTIIVNRRGEIVDANCAFAELLGIDLASTIGGSTIDLIHPDDRPEIDRRMAAAMEGRPILEARELRLRRPDGTNLVVMMHPSTVTPGQRQGAVVQLVDLTSQRRAEVHLALHHELLELVAAGTPLAEVATAVALNIGRAIDGATGAVLLSGSAPFTAPDLSTDWEPDRSTWRVPIDPSRPALGAVIIAPQAPRVDGDKDTAAMLASIVRLAVQRDESAGATSGFALHESFDDQIGRSIGWLGRVPSTVAVIAIGPVDFDALLAERGWRGTESTLADMSATVRRVVSNAALVARRGHQILVLVDLAATDDDVDELGARIAARADIAVGIATATDDLTTPHDLLDHASEALAAARLRDDRVAVFGPSMRERSAADSAGDELLRALEADEVKVHYQPIIDLRTGQTVSLEALVRWEHRTRGFVPPPELIATAEACGLIREIGALVLATSCRDLAQWRAAGHPDLSVAVNISAVQLADDDLVALVSAALAEHGLDPSALVVEITESVVVTDVDHVAAALTELRALGVRVAIDDFGTGYSSLLYLKRFPADVLKVDRSFVQGLGVHEGDTAIVEAVVGLGHRLGLQIVAEGVETDEQLAELRRRRCDQAQGYLLQRPASADDVSRFLTTGDVDLGPELSVLPAPDLDVDELLSLVTHELSTPLSVIGGHAELLADLLRRDDDSPSAVIDALERNIRNLDDLLRSLGGLSHALGAPGKTSPVDLASFVEQTTHDLAPLLAQHDVRVALPAGPIAADVEPVALRQIITNLLSNAVKFTDPGTVVDVTVSAGEADHRVVVADHGPGVPVDREAELFGRFSRLGSRARGLGLGLHLSRELARRHGGDLVHHATPGGGATFVLHIPR